MLVRSERSYAFDVGPDELWAALTRVDDYCTWWPWLRNFEARAFAPGERWQCVVQPPLPYSLQFAIVLDDVVAPERATATIEGDIVGDASLVIHESAAGSELALVSQLAPANALLRAVAAVARPVVQYGHDWVLDTGLRQFRSAAL